MKHEYVDQYMNRTYSSYSEYKSLQEDAKLQYLIHRKYLKVLGKFMEDMYFGLRFDIFIKHRDPKVKDVKDAKVRTINIYELEKLTLLKLH